MSNIINDAVRKLSDIIEKAPLKWDEFEAALNGLKDINFYDDQYEETILSGLLMYGCFYNRGEILADVVRRFLACGYDISANDGLNGGLALHALAGASYDHRFLEAAKVLMNAGASVSCRTGDDDPDEEPEGLLGSIRWKLSGAWMVDKDFGFANTLEAYYAMTEAHIAGKDYNSIDTCFACIEKPLSAVSAIKDGNAAALQKEGNLWVFSEPLILWFDDKPLVASCYTDFVVNPVHADDKKADLADISSVFSSLIGATLKEIQYIGTTICFFAFSNGMRLIFASRDIGNRKRAGTFEIRTIADDVDIEQFNIDCICAINGLTFADTVTDYSEDAIALFCGDAAYLLYPRTGTANKYHFGLCPCSGALLSEYTRQYPLGQPVNIACMHGKDGLSALRFDYTEGHLYIKTAEYYEIKLQLSDKLYDPLTYSTLPHKEGKHMEFLKRKEP